MRTGTEQKGRRDRGLLATMLTFFVLAPLARAAVGADSWGSEVLAAVIVVAAALIVGLLVHRLSRRQ